MLATPGSGYIAYDVSKDGGITWSVNNQVFNPTLPGTANARYPQGVIYNPAGNTVPDNSYFSGFYPTLDGSNATDSWGGYGASTVKLDGTGLSQIGWPSDPPIRHNVPDGMALNRVTGDIFTVEPAKVDGLGNQYTDTLVLVRGVFNSSTGAYDYEETPLFVPMMHSADASSIADCKIEFAPDGQIGYIMMIGDNEMDPFATGLAYYPVLYKTTDGGITWDSDPITVIMSGSDGIEGIINDLLTDEQIATLFEPPLPARDEILYTTAFTSDFAVDFNGNPVISIVIGVASATAYSIISEPGTFASYNLFSRDQGETWYGVKLGSNLKTFRGTWGDASEDNRSQITSTYDGTMMFFSWLDTDFEGVTDNNQPDIFCAGWNLIDNTYTEVVNVTYLSDAWLQAYMGTASTYALIPAAGTYEIPFAYQSLDATLDPTKPVQYKYIGNFTFADADFTITNTNEINTQVPMVSQNYPNPFKDRTQITLNLSGTSTVGLEVYNLVGQKVFELPSSTMSKGTNVLTIPGKNLQNGVYTYSVNINGERFTHKMIVN